MNLEERVQLLERRLKEVKDLVKAIGGQNSELKTRCNNLEIDVKILKQGGNL